MQEQFQFEHAKPKEPSMPDIVLPTGMDAKQEEPQAVKQPAQPLATTEARMATTTVARERRTKLATIH